MKSKMKIFEGTVRSALKDCLAAGYRPATLQEVTLLTQQGKIPLQFYDTSTLWWKQTGVIKDATLSELQNYERIVEQEGQLLFLSLSHLGLSGDFNPGIIGRFVGVAPEAQHKNKKNSILTVKMVSKSQQKNVKHKKKRK